MEEKPTLEWSAPEYREKNRSVDWFWALGVIAVASAVTAIIYKNYLFAIFIILAALVLGFLAVRSPETILFKITAKDVELGREKYPYARLKSFFILEKEAESILFVMSNRSVVPLISVPLGDTDPVRVREVLSVYLPEEHRDEPTAHKIMDYLGF
ncbi:MAG: hypothetical protein MUD00_00870 [Candidatus Pacebacteria bacterium]|nr:hypothetical protein [Candidatus Paceibacterota bacterium]